MTTNYTCNALPNVSNSHHSHHHQYQSGTSAGHPRYDTTTSLYPSTVTGGPASSNPSYWSASNSSNGTHTANNFHQNCYSNYHYGVNVPSGPVTPAPVQNNSYPNTVPPPPPPPPPPAPVVLYPHLYSSTVNQNQIHLHLHHTELNKPVEHYANDVATVVGNSNLTISGAGNSRSSIEIGIVQSPNQTTAAVEEQNDLVINRYSVERQNNEMSVWRPY